MPKGRMAVANTTPLQSHLRPSFTHSTAVPEEEPGGGNLEDIPNFRAEGRECPCDREYLPGFSSRELQLRHTKSTESLNSLLRSLPDVVIPETLYNPLPLQCLAASALPEAIREEIDGVLDRYSTVMDSSVCQLQSSVETPGSGSPGLVHVLTRAELEGGGLSGVDLVDGEDPVDGEASVSEEVVVEPERAANGTYPISNEVRGSNISTLGVNHLC